MGWSWFWSLLPSHAEDGYGRCIPYVDTLHSSGDAEGARGRLDVLAGAFREAGAQRGQHVHVSIHLTGLAWCLVSTSPHAPRLRPRLLSLLAIQFTIKIALSVIADPTVLPIQSISSAVRCSQAFRDLHRPPAQPPTLPVTSGSAHLERNLTALHYIVPRWEAGRQAPLSSLSLTALPRAPSSSCIHHLSHTQNSFLSCNRTTKSCATANTCAYFVYPH